MPRSRDDGQQQPVEEQGLDAAIAAQLEAMSPEQRERLLKQAVIAKAKRRAVQVEVDGKKRVRRLAWWCLVVARPWWRLPAAAGCRPPRHRPSVGTHGVVCCVPRPPCSTPLPTHQTATTPAPWPPQTTSLYKLMRRMARERRKYESGAMDETVRMTPRWQLQQATPARLLRRGATKQQLRHWEEAELELVRRAPRAPTAARCMAGGVTAIGRRCAPTADARHAPAPPAPHAAGPIWPGRGDQPAPCAGARAGRRAPRLCLGHL